MTHEKNIERIAQIKKTMRMLEKKICTYETRENPLSMVDVEKVVEQYFL